MSTICTLRMSYGRPVRRSIEDEVARLIDMLDGMDPDADFEPWLGSVEFDGKSAAGFYDRRTGQWFSFQTPAADQTNWSASASDEREAEDEHGGDVQDERHDEEPDREPSLGWTVDGQLGDGRDLDEVDHDAV